MCVLCYKTTSRKSKTITSTLSSITRTLSQIKDISRTYNYLPWIICLDIFFLNQDYLLSYTSSGWHFNGVKFHKYWFIHLRRVALMLNIDQRRMITGWFLYTLFASGIIMSEAAEFGPLSFCCLVYRTAWAMCRGFNISSNAAPFRFAPRRLASCKSQPDKSQFWRKKSQIIWRAFRISNLLYMYSYS